jgi:tetratricopeptide (TPR) repeat protein
VDTPRDERDDASEGVVRQDSPLILDPATTAIVAGVDFWAKSDFEESLQHFQKALLLRENEAGSYDQDTIKIYFWIGLTLWSMEEFDRALIQFRRTLRLGVVVWGPEHDTCLVVKQWIHKILQGKGMSPTYINIYQKALWDSISHQVKGVRCLLFEKGSEAYREFHKALRLERSCNEPNREATLDEADIIAQIGDALMCLGRYEEAYKHYSSALAIHRKKLNPDHSSVVQTSHKMTSAASKVMTKVRNHHQMQIVSFADTHQDFQTVPAISIPTKESGGGGGGGGGVATDEPNIVDAAARYLGNYRDALKEYSEAISSHQRQLETSSSFILTTYKQMTQAAV